MRYAIYNKEGEIIRIVGCPPEYAESQVKDDEGIIEAPRDVNDVTQKIEFDGFDEKGQPINPRVVNKTPAEIEADNPAPIPLSLEKQPAHITNEQWQGILNRLDNLEAK